MTRREAKRAVKKINSSGTLVFGYPSAIQIHNASRMKRGNMVKSAKERIQMSQKKSNTNIRVWRRQRKNAEKGGSPGVKGGDQIYGNRENKKIIKVETRTGTALFHKHNLHYRTRGATP